MLNNLFFYLFRILRILRPFLQFVFYILAIYIALSRISDYRHHPTDVITGIILGNLFAFLILYLTVDLFRRPRSFYHARYTAVDHIIQVESQVQPPRLSQISSKCIIFCVIQQYCSVFIIRFHFRIITQIPKKEFMRQTESKLRLKKCQKVMQNVQKVYETNRTTEV